MNALAIRTTSQDYIFAPDRARIASDDCIRKAEMVTAENFCDRVTDRLYRIHSVVRNCNENRRCSTVRSFRVCFLR